MTLLLGSAGGLEDGPRGYLQGSSGAFGTALAVGDFDRDGFDDLAVGSPLEANSSGVVRIYRGTGGGMFSSPSWTFNQNSSGIPGGVEAGDSFGFALAAGDFNGDGRDDLAVGAPNEGLSSGNRAGVVAVIYSNGGGLSGSGAMGFAQNSPGVPGGLET